MRNRWGLGWVRMRRAVLCFEPRGLRRFLRLTQRPFPLLGRAPERLELALRFLTEHAVALGDVLLHAVAIFTLLAAALETGQRLLIRDIARLEAITLGARRARAIAQAGSNACARAERATRERERGDEYRKSEAHAPRFQH